MVHGCAARPRRAQRGRRWLQTKTKKTTKVPTTGEAPQERDARPRPSLQPEAVADGLGGSVQLSRQLVRVDDGPHPLPARLRAAERAHGVVDGKIALAHLLGYVHSRIVSVVYGVANKRFSFLNSDATLDTTGHHETITRHHETINY